MKKNLFAAEPRTEQAEAREVREPQARRLSAPDYTASPCGLPDHILAFILGFVAGFAVLYIFYKFIPAAVLGGAVTGVVYVFVAEQKAMDKRIRRLRVQFFDLLEAMSVAMRAGNPVLKALESAREDLSLIYSQQSDTITARRWATPRPTSPPTWATTGPWRKRPARPTLPPSCSAPDTKPITAAA